MEIGLDLVILLGFLLVVLVVVGSLGWLVLAGLAGMLWVGKQLLRATVRMIQ